MNLCSRRDLLRILGTALPVWLGANAAQRRPNVVFILADDLGWRDTSVGGSDFFETPNLERLAERGMQFSQAYAACPLCSPTRASIMTGLYPGRIGITRPACHLPEVILEKKLAAPEPDQRAVEAASLTRLKLEYRTMAEAFKDAGYRTAHFGKWHLGREPYDALHQGFEVDVPHTFEAGPTGGYLAPWKVWPSDQPAGRHIDEHLAEEAARFIQANKDQPFYVNFWPFSVHSPWQAKPELVAKYKAKAARSGSRRNPVYGAMVESMDTAIGRVLKALEDAGVAQNTIIVFFSDNGGVHWSANDEKAMLHPEYTKIPLTNNAPLQGGKATLYEGGTREPLLVVWPGVVKPGSRSAQVVSSVDFFPTLLETAGLRAQAGQDFDGISIVPALRGQKLKRSAIFCHFPHYIALTGNAPGTWVREGDWKLIRFYCDNDDQTDRFELYNLKIDLSEKNNLAGTEPARVRRLRGLIEKHLRETAAVIPQPNPKYRRMEDQKK